MKRLPVAIQSIATIANELAPEALAEAKRRIAS